MGRRQHTALAGDRGARVRPVHVVGGGGARSTVHVARARRRGDARRLRRRVRQLRHRRAPSGGVAATDLVRAAGAARLRQPAGRRERRNLVAGAGVPAGDDRRTRRGRLGAVLDPACRQRRARRRRLERGLLLGIHAGRWRPAARGQLRLEPTVRGALRHRADDGGAHGRRAPTRASGRSSSPACCAAPTTRTGRAS